MITKTALALAAPLLLNIAATSPVAYADGTISSCPTTITSGGTWTLTKDLPAAPGVTCVIVAASMQGATTRGARLDGDQQSASAGTDAGRFADRRLKHKRPGDHLWLRQ